MECEETYLLITGFVESELGERERVLFEMHVKECTNCTAFFQTYVKTRDIVSTLLCDEMHPDMASKVSTLLRKIIKNRKKPT